MQGNADSKLCMEKQRAKNNQDKPEEVRGLSLLVSRLFIARYYMQRKIVTKVTNRLVGQNREYRNWPITHIVT